MSGYVVELERIDRSMVALVGGKGANLGELSRLGGVRVPAGFCVTTRAYADVIGGSAAVTALLDELPGSAARLREAIEATPLPDDLADEIRAGLAALGPAEAFAVRSSATAEDLPDASFAGQQDTYLNVVGADAVLAAVRRCWASLFTDRAVAYRAEHGVDGRDVRLAVVVQRLIVPEVAGILFTADPVTSNRRAMAVDAGFGLGEALVSGLADPDHYTVQDGAVTGRSIGAQAIAVSALPGGGTEEVRVEDGRRRVQKLTDAQILRLAAIGRTIETHFGSPQDIEWALADDAFWVVQSRPITTLFPIPGPQDGRNHVYLSFGHQQMMTDAMTPLGLSFFQTQLDTTPLIAAGGRLFIDLAPDLASPVGRRLVLASMKSIDPLMDGGLKPLVARPGFLKNLAGDGPRYLSASGAGYFSWRLPVETLRAYIRNDPSVAATLRNEQDASLQRLRAGLIGLSGEALFDRIEADLQQSMKTEVTDPRGMGMIYVGLYALHWVNKHVERWLGVKGAGDSLAQLIDDDVTSQMGRALARIAALVAARPAVREALPGLADDTFLDELSAVEGGGAVADALREFLERYGMRCPGEIDVTRTRWSERPSALVPMILSVIASGNRDLPDAEELRRDLLRRLGRLPGGRRKAARMRTMISRLRNFAGYREYPKYLMMRHYWILKQAMLAEAGRLVGTGAIARIEDVYSLTFAEFRDAVRTGTVDAGLIARRRAEFDAWTRLTPPRLITSSGEVPPAGYDTDALPDGALPGIAASAGTVEGRARVVLSQADAHLEDGDILVTRFTDPSWTPVFLSVRGIVTEVGGAMTHGAVVAREYGLPAVVGVDGATRLIPDGRRIRVNGTEGYVELL